MLKNAMKIFLYILVVGTMTLKAQEPYTLATCPNSPNCVNSLANDAGHAIAPFPIIGTVEASLDRLCLIIQSLPRTKIIFIGKNYLHAEFTSRIFRFIDDVEFLGNPSENVIEVRSASRIGYGDLGVNRQRIEALRSLYQTFSDK